MLGPAAAYFGLVLAILANIIMLATMAAAFFFYSAMLIASIMLAEGACCLVIPPVRFRILCQFSLTLFLSTRTLLIVSMSLA